ncbi:prephenate dehydratase domain-containing protein, partial [Thermodesulfobacteriota bacterium]
MTRRQESEEKLRRLREEIDRIDDAIVDLLNRRLNAASEIGRAKRQASLPITDETRERQILKRLEEKNKGPMSAGTLRFLFSEIMAAARQVQDDAQVAYLGPEATFTHLAAQRHFGRAARLIAQSSIEDVFGEVERGRCPFGVVPVENSMEGAVHQTLDFLYTSDVLVVAEVYCPISHDLLSAEESLDEVRLVFSHPQAFAQCRSWLRRHLPHVRCQESSSTSEAARQASQTRGAAAIASSEAGRAYGLDVLAEFIQDSSRNVTRFLVVGKDAV